MTRWVRYVAGCGLLLTGGVMLYLGVSGFIHYPGGGHGGWYHLQDSQNMLGGVVLILFGLSCCVASTAWRLTVCIILSCVLALPIAALLHWGFVPVDARSVGPSSPPALTELVGRFTTTDKRASFSTLELRTDGTYLASPFPAENLELPLVSGTWKLTERSPYCLILDGNNLCQLRGQQAPYDIEMFFGDPDEGAVLFKRR